jgi:hypothetical protein
MVVAYDAGGRFLAFLNSYLQKKIASSVGTGRIRARLNPFVFSNMSILINRNTKNQMSFLAMCNLKPSQKQIPMKKR